VKTGENFLSNRLVDFLKSIKLNFEIVEQTPKGLILEFNVQAKPAAKVEKIFVNAEGNLAIQTRAKPVDGEANQAIVESVADLIGVPKYQVEILRGDKSKNKRIKLLVEFTAKKTVESVLEKLREKLSAT
jgi:uncharacterized protein (TIGR00251 family)